jgi:hypothetical protein
VFFLFDANRFGGARVTDSSRTKSVLRWAVDLIAIGGLAGILMLVYLYEARMMRSSRDGSGGRAQTSDGTGGLASSYNGWFLEGSSPDVAGRPVETVGGTAGPIADTRGAAAPGSSQGGPAPPSVATRTRREPHNVSRTLKLAVSQPAFDDIGKLLKQMGQGYMDFDTLDWSQLQDPEQLRAYDVLFLTCNEPKYLPDRAAATIRDFVHSGNTLYVSDLWYALLARAFPEAGALTTNIELGKEQEIIAEVVDPSLQQTMGKRLKLTFEKKGWVPARFSGPLVTPLIRGRFEVISGASRDEPLLVKFPAGRGTILFTSFHNSPRVSESELKLLKSLVVIVATARVERDLRETAIRR